jgi:protein archease
MQPFRVLEHTADIGFEAFGSTREEVFANAAAALVSLVFDLGTIEPKKETRIRVEGADPPALLVNWLSEVLYLLDAERWAFREFQVVQLSDHAISAVARGEEFDRARHPVKLLVKAITYHQLGLEPMAEGWRAQVFVDI